MERETKRSTTTTINNLPETVLWLIVSLLPYVDAVRTGILSKKWRNLWCSRPRWDLDYNKFPCTNNRTDDFERFVSQVVYSHMGPHTEYVKINHHQYNKNSRENASEWLKHIMMFKIVGLDISIIAEPVLPPHRLFNSPTLVDLRLRLNSQEFNILYTVSLPKLRTLHLKFAKFMCPIYFNALITGCPVLSILLLEKCDFFDISRDCDLYIYHPSLTEVVFKGCYGIGRKNLHLSTPNLSKLTYRGRGFVDRQTDFQDLSSLSTAILELSERAPTYLHQVPEDVRETRVLHMYQLMSAIHNISSLVLSEMCIEHLSMPIIQTNLPMFIQLEKLSASMWPNKSHAYMITQLIGSCPALKHLELTVTEFVSPRWHEGMSEYPETPDFLSTDMPHYHLQRVDMRKLTGRGEELLLIRFLLRNALALECLTISTIKWNNHARRRNFATKILSYPRPSAAKIRFY